MYRNFIAMTKEEYNDIPVYYCKNCLSLAILRDGDTGCFCNDCGNTDTSMSNIDTWEFLYEQEFGELFLDYGREQSGSKG